MDESRKYVRDLEESRKNVRDFMEMITPFLNLHKETISKLEGTLNKICALAYVYGIREGINFIQNKNENQTI